MRKRFIGSLIFFLLAVYVAIAARDFGLGEWRMPGPGFYPFGAALLLGIISLKEMVTALRTPSPKEEAAIPGLPPPERIHWGLLVQVMAGMIAYSLLLKWIGFVICTFLMVLFFMRVLAKERLFTALVTALSIAAGSELIFNVFLNAQIPSGILTFLRR